MGHDARWMAEWYRRGLIRGESKPAPFGVLSAPRGPHVAERVGRLTDGLDEPYVLVSVPIRTVNPLNLREHYGARARRAKRERETTAMALIGVLPATWAALAHGCEVRLTRVSPRRVSDEGIAAALKHVRDVVAQHLFDGQVGERDDDPRARWDYGQLRGGPGRHGVIVSVRRWGK